MALVPGKKPIIKFDEELRGSFGRFKTNNSFNLEYLMTTIPIGDIEQLSTASEQFRLETINFEELIQRDIDHNRVRKIANEYLSCGKGRVIFFPPLLACVVLVEESGAIKRKYRDVFRETAPSDDMHVLRTTWDDGFQLDLPIGDQNSSERYLVWQDQKYYFYDFAASLKLNTARARLVVLDGQHRLEAMKLLRKNPEQKNIIDGLEIPICLVWSPEALEGTQTDEDMMRDFRELFVRVNVEPRKVSGHFITLLRDDSYAAMTMRQLADYWKELTLPGDWSRLHLLEWNTREDERVDIRTRGDFSITTVSIIAKTLEQHLFSAEIAPDLLDLESKEEAFRNCDEDFSFYGLSDKTHESAIDNIVKGQIDKILVPALDTIFRKAAPYARLEAAIGDAFEKLQLKVDENNGSFINLKSNLNDHIYREEEMFETSTVSAYIDFRKWIVSNPSDRIFFYAVFQQGLIRFWLNVAILLKPFGLKANDSAKVMLVALDALCFKPDIKYFSNEQKYTKRLLWRNENINFSSNWAKKAWTDLIGASLLNLRVRNSIVSYLNKEFEMDKQSLTEVEIQLNTAGRKYASAYLDRYKEELIRETRASFEDFFSEERSNQLRAQKTSLQEQERKKFEAVIIEKAEARFIEGFDELANQLLISSDDLRQIVNAD